MRGTDYSSRLLNRLSKLQINRKLCDVKFLCADGNVEAHSAVLAVSCPALYQLITSASLTIPLEGYTTELVQSLLTYIYSGEIECNNRKSLLNFTSLASQLFQVNLHLPYTDEGCHEEEQFSVTKRRVQFKLCTFNLETEIPELRIFKNNDGGDVNVTKSSGVDHLVLPDASVTCKITTGKDDRKNELGKQEPCNSPDRNSKSSDNNLTTEQGDSNTDDCIAKRGKSQLASEESEKLVNNISKKIMTRTKMKRRGVKKSTFTKNAKRKMFAERGSKKKQFEKKTSEWNVDMNIQNDENDLKEGENTADWIVHRRGDWNLDKYKNTVQNKNKRTLPYLCVMCGHRAHDMRHHLNHLHCKHKIPYKTEDIGKWVDVCPYEGCNYTAALNMKSHIFHIHETEAGIFTCDTCKKIFKRESGLRTHLRRHHIKPGELKPCPECGKMVSSHYIEKHIATVHNPDNYYLCSHCHFKTKALASARFHMITKHNDYSLGKVTIHKCKYCEYQGTHVDNIKRHVKAVHEIKMGLQNKDVLCDICGKAFAHQRTMASHRLWHTNKDRYKCEFCSFSAPFSRHVKVHTQRQHTQKELRPWRCTHCTYASNDRGNLKKHLLNTHKLPEPDVVEIMKASLTSAQSQQNQQNDMSNTIF